MQAENPTLILDVMGAERGIDEVVRGAAQAAQQLSGTPTKFVLVTARVEETERAITRIMGTSPGCELELVPADQTLPLDFSSPVDVYRSHPECSIRKAMDLAKTTPYSSVISPGTTGLVMTAAMFTLGRVRGIDRAPIGTPMPTRKKHMFFVDGGSVVDCKARHLYQFAVLAHLYVKNLLHIEHPSIALLSNGSEEYKGNLVVKEAYDLIVRDHELNFVGYIEGHNLFDGNVDIMVCDGFLGNILLKFAEGASTLVSEVLREEITRNPFVALLSKLLLSGSFRRFKRRMDYAEIGGAPLLGLNGNVVICHGRSPALAFKNALLFGRDLAVSGISRQVAHFFAENPELRVHLNGVVPAAERRTAISDRRSDCPADQ